MTAPEVVNLQSALANLDMRATLDSIFRPRRRVDPEILERAAERAGELTGVPSGDWERVLAEM